MPVCKVCKESKAVRDMRAWGTNVTETCQVCYDAKKAAKNGAPPKSSEKAPEAAASPPPAPAPRLIAVTEMICEASLGFTARIDGEQIVISQANGAREELTADDNITLTRAEAKKLFDAFGEWIVSS